MQWHVCVFRHALVSYSSMVISNNLILVSLFHYPNRGYLQLCVADSDRANTTLSFEPHWSRKNRTRRVWRLHSISSISGRHRRHAAATPLRSCTVHVSMGAGLSEGQTCTLNGTGLGVQLVSVWVRASLYEPWYEPKTGNGTGRVSGFLWPTRCRWLVG